MSFLRKANNAKTTINQIGGLAIGDLSLIVADASSFPTEGDFLVTIWNNTLYPDPTDDINREIIKVTSVSGNTFTLLRGQEDTVAVVHSNGSMVAMLITAGTFEEIEEAINNHIANKNNPHEVTAEQISTNTSGETVQSKLDDLQIEIDNLTVSDQVFNDVLTDQVDGITYELITSFDYEPGTLNVYLNGVRQVPGISKDFIETGDNTFEFTDIPLSGWLVTVDYVKKGSSVNKVFNEDLTSQVDGINVEFITAFNYETGSLQLYLNGFRQIEGIGKDFVETGSNTFEFIVAPNSSAKVVLDYNKG